MKLLVTASLPAVAMQKWQGRLASLCRRKIRVRAIALLHLLPIKMLMTIEQACLLACRLTECD